MSARLGALAALLIPLIVALGVLAWRVARSEVPRRTVDRFATRQRLRLTRANAVLVVSALLITHRWRRAGLVLGLLVGLVWSLQQGAVTLHFGAGLLGWFVGAVIAEWRISSSLEQPGPRRAAMVAPRGITTFLTPSVIAVAGLVLVALVGLVLGAAVRSGLSASWLGWVLYSAALLAALGLTGRAVIERASGFVDDDVRDADEALRCHGLTVLAGSGVAVAYPPLAGLAALMARSGTGAPSAEPGWTLLLMLGCLAIGYLLAVASPSTRASRVGDPAEARST